MKITITESASKELHKRIGNHKGYLKIFYDTDGCGCGPGVFTLLFVTAIDENNDIVFESNNLPIIIEKSHLIYLDDELTIDCSNTTNFLKLSSPQETYNGALTFIFQ